MQDRESLWMNKKNAGSHVEKMQTSLLTKTWILSNHKIYL